MGRIERGGRRGKEKVGLEEGEEEKDDEKEEKVRRGKERLLVRKGQR